MAADPLGGEAAAGPAPRQHPQQGARLPPGGEQDRGPAADVQPPRQSQERSGGAVQQDGRVCGSGKVIMINPEKDKTMVQELLDVNWKEEIRQYLKSYFRSNDKFVTCEESI